MCPRTVVHRRKCTLKRTLWPELPSILSQQLQQSQIPQPSISRILHEIASKGPVYSEIQRSSIPVLTPYLSEMLPETKNENFFLPLGGRQKLRWNHDPARSSAPFAVKDFEVSQ